MKALRQTIACSGMAFMSVICVVLMASHAQALAGPTTATATETATQQRRLQAIITKGDAEISRRLTSLGNAATRITNTTKLTASNKAALSSEVSSEISGLTALQSSLNADTTISAAHTDAESIINGYRVYALILPKSYLIGRADDQLGIEAKLTTLAQKLQTRLNTEKTKGKDVTSLQTSLNDMILQVTNAQAISNAIESKVLPLQPSDYNTDHTILSGDNGQLKTARTDIQAAYNDAKAIIGALKTL